MPDDAGVEVQLLVHREEQRIALFFPWNKDVIARVRNFPGARWSATRKCWHVPWAQESVHLITGHFSEIHFRDGDFPNTLDWRKPVTRVKKEWSKGKYIKLRTEGEGMNERGVALMAFGRASNSIKSA